MSAQPDGEPTRHTDDVLARLAAIDHRLHQITTRLAAVDQLISQLDDIRANLETLIKSLGPAMPIVAGAACGPSDLQPPPSTATAGARPDALGYLAGEVHALADLLAQVVELAASRAVFPGRWAQIAEEAMEHSCVRRAVCGLSGGSQVPDLLARNGDGR